MGNEVVSYTFMQSGNALIVEVILTKKDSKGTVVVNFLYISHGGCHANTVEKY